MMNLAEYRRRTQSLADFLPWAALVEKGVILNKDGSFQRTARFRGPDLDSVTPAELVAITSRLNNALRRLGSGWAVFIEAQRVPAHRYPVGQFPRRAPAPGREDHSGPRLHLHARERQRHRGVARFAAGSRLRQCPPAARLDAQSCAHDAVLCGVGRAGTG